MRGTISLMGASVDRLGGRAQWFILIALALIFSGFERLFAAWLPLPHHGFDLLIVAAIVIIVSASGFRRLARVPGAGIYAAWILFYFGYGLAVAANRQAVWQPALRGLELNLLVIAAVATAVRDRTAAGNLANLIQVAVLANVGLAIVQAAYPELTSLLANSEHAGMYALQRPAGFWLNPNEAGIAYLFAILLSNWASPWQKWLGRIGGAVGIFLTASRGAMFPFVTYVLVMLFIENRNRLPRLRLRSLALATGLALVLVLAGAGFLAMVHPPGTGSIVEALRYPLSRFQNFAEATPEGNDAPRLPLAIYWFERAIRGPVQGAGVFSFQGNGTTVVGAHNIFLTVWGETGAFGLFLYLAVLTMIFRPSLDRSLALADRLALSAMWVLYVVEGFLWHNQFTSVVGILIIALLVCLPNAVNTRVSRLDCVTKTVSGPPATGARGAGLPISG